MDGDRVSDGAREVGVRQERLQRVRSALRRVVHGDLADSLCPTCTGVLSVSGAAVVVTSEQTHRGLLCSSDDVARALEDLQDTVGQGPSIDAYRRGAAVAEPDLATPRRTRWEAFTAPALDLGASAVFAFPMRIGAARLGVVSLYQKHPGDLSEDQYADARTVADLVTDAIIALQAAAPPGDLATPLDVIPSDRAELHQATGMVAAHLEIGAGEALVRLRARAYADGRPLLDVARDVVARRLRLD
jgi:hypothetical protein